MLYRDPEQGGDEERDAEQDRTEPRVRSTRCCPDWVTHVCPRSQFEMKHSSLGEKYFMEQSENYLIQTLEISQLIPTWEALNATVDRAHIEGIIESKLAVVHNLVRIDP